LFAECGGASAPGLLLAPDDPTAADAPLLAVARAVRVVRAPIFKPASCPLLSSREPPARLSAPVRRRRMLAARDCRRGLAVRLAAQRACARGLRPVHAHAVESASGTAHAGEGASSSGTAPEEERFAVVGAGFAGVACCYHLLVRVGGGGVVNCAAARMAALHRQPSCPVSKALLTRLLSGAAPDPCRPPATMALPTACSAHQQRPRASLCPTVTRSFGR